MSQREIDAGAMNPVLLCTHTRSLVALVHHSHDASFAQHRLSWTQFYVTGEGANVGELEEEGV